MFIYLKLKNVSGCYLWYRGLKY